MSQLINFVTQLFIAESINNYNRPIFYFLYKKSGFQCSSSSVGDSQQQAMNKRVKNSVTRNQNAVMCLLVGVLSAAFTHVDACHTVDENKNDSK